VTPRERDPAVWAAAYGAAWADFYRIAFEGTDGHPADRRRIALEVTSGFADVITSIADAAVNALHPEEDYSGLRAAFARAVPAHLLHEVPAPPLGNVHEHLDGGAVSILASKPVATVQVMGERVPRGSATDLRAEASKRERAGDFDGEGALLDRANVLDRLAALEAAARAVCDHACARPTSDPLSVPARLIAALHEALNDYARSRQQPTT
jgi:hypothetical protein